jgi:hypothetical protein
MIPPEARRPIFIFGKSISFPRVASFVVVGCSAAPAIPAHRYIEIVHEMEYRVGRWKARRAGARCPNADPVARGKEK